MHCLCAFLIYGLWWSKPLDIQESSILSGDKAEQICALMAMSSTLSSPSWALFEHYHPWDPNFHPRFRIDRGLPQDIASPMTLINSWPSSSSTMAVQLPCRIFEFVARPSLDLSGKSMVHISKDDFMRWKLASKALNDMPHLPEVNEIDAERRPFQSGVASRVRNLQGAEHFGSADFLTLSTALILAPAVYGGLHCLAWNLPFSMAWEQLIWRISSVCIAASGAGAILYMGFLKLIIILAELPEAPRPEVNEKLKIVWPGPVGSLLQLHRLIVFPAALIYLFVRAFIVVECFTQLARLPPAVYTEPAWSRYYPHIT